MFQFIYFGYISKVGLPYLNLFFNFKSIKKAQLQFIIGGPSYYKYKPKSKLKAQWNGKKKSHIRQSIGFELMKGLELSRISFDPNEVAFGLRNTKEFGGKISNN